MRSAQPCVSPSIPPVQLGFLQRIQLWQPRHMLATEQLGTGRGLVHMGP